MKMCHIAYRYTHTTRRPTRLASLSLCVWGVSTRDLCACIFLSRELIIENIYVLSERFNVYSIILGVSRYSPYTLPPDATRAYAVY